MRRPRRTIVAAVVIVAFIVASPRSAQSDAAPLTVVAKIPLPDGKGRIDHLAYDAGRRRLYVAELGNDSVGIVDVARQRFERRVPGFAEPQGIAYLATTDAVYVSTAGDGFLRAFHAADMSKMASAKLGEDADNVRVDATAARVYVGFGGGGIAILDPGTLERLGDIPLRGHPEGFQLSATDERIFVNVPDAREIAVIGRFGEKQLSSWPVTEMRGNFPMAIDEAGGQVISVFRSPAHIASFQASTGKIVRAVEACGDADDVFVDARRLRVYVVCGEGVVDVLNKTTLERIARIQTASGARTGLFSPDADLLFIAARATPDSGAAVWVLKPGD